MSEKPSLQKFKSTLEEIFGQKLTPEAELATDDFFNSWRDLFEGLKNESIRINVDMLFLSKNFPEYGQYKGWKGLSMIIILIGLVLFFFSWKIAVAALVLGIGISFYSKIAKSSAGRKFIDEIKKELNNNPSMGMAKICTHYIAGTIQLASQYGQAHWPVYPSSVFGGDVRFIQK